MSKTHILNCRLKNEDVKAGHSSCECKHCLSSAKKNS